MDQQQVNDDELEKILKQRMNDDFNPSSPAYQKRQEDARILADERARRSQELSEGARVNDLVGGILKSGEAASSIGGERQGNINAFDNMFANSKNMRAQALDLEVLSRKEDAARRESENKRIYEYLQDRREDRRHQELLGSQNAKMKQDQNQFNARLGLDKDKLTAEANKPPEIKPDQYKAGGFVKRMEQAEQVFNNLTQSGYKRDSGWEAFKSKMVPDTLGNKLGMDMGSGQQQAQAESNFITSALRRESGASISPSEYETAEAQYFPRAGDTSGTLAQKAANRKQVVESLKAESGGAYAAIPSVPAPLAQKNTSGQALAGPAAKPIEHMSDEEIKAELGQ